MGDRGLVDVEIVGKGDGNYCDGQIRPTTDVQIKTTRGATVWVPEKDVIARKPNPETAALGGDLPYFPTV